MVCKAPRGEGCQGLHYGPFEWGLKRVKRMGQRGRLSMPQRFARPGGGGYFPAAVSPAPMSRPAPPRLHIRPPLTPPVTLRLPHRQGLRALLDGPRRLRNRTIAPPPPPPPAGRESPPPGRLVRRSFARRARPSRSAAVCRPALDPPARRRDSCDLRRPLSGRRRQRCRHAPRAACLPPSVTFAARATE